MSNTPRVDEELQRLNDAIRAGEECDDVAEAYTWEFARQLERELAEVQAENVRLALEIENQQYTITCASEENQQLKESLAEARAEIERLREYTTCTLESTDAEMDDKDVEIAKRDKLIEQMRDALKALKQRHYVNDDDNWYSCPASGLCSDDYAGTDCNCGADHANSIIEAALSAADGGE
jgi:predicted RNase H-like nuclease (RuvC/YqgF family)